MIEKKDLPKLILDSIYDTIDEINLQDDQEQKLEKSHSTILLGKGSKLDSLGLVNFIVSLEENLEDNLDLELTLADQRAMNQDSSPFSSVKSLSEYILKLATESFNE